MATETWIINETFDAYNASYDIAVSYTSGGRHFDQISFGNKSSTTYYALIYSYKASDGIFHTVMPLNSGNWSISGYRTIIFDSPVTDANLLNWLQTRAVKKSNVSFKRYYKFPVLLGSGSYKFQPYTVAQPKLATVSGVSVAEKNLSFEAVKNAAEYEVLLDGVSVGTVENVINYTLSWSWACTVFINDTQVSTGSGSRTTIKAGDKIKVTTSGSNYISTSFPDIPVNPFVDGTYTFPAQDISLGTISNPRVSKAQNITMILT